MIDEQTERDGQSTGGSVRKQMTRFVPVGVVLLGLALGYAFGLQDYLSLGFLAEQRQALRSYVDAHSLWSAVLFVSVYILAVAATIGASILFLATRSAFGSFLRHRVDGVVKTLAEGFREDAFGYLFVIRLAPVFPFFVVNIAAALFDISLGRFVAATFLGILPGTFAYAYLGQGVDSVLVAAQQAGREAEISDLVTGEITLAFLALAAIALTPTIVRQLRRRGSG